MAPSSGPSYDIAMLALATPSVAATVALTSGSTPLIDGETVWAAGFGITETGESSDILRCAALPTWREALGRLPARPPAAADAALAAAICKGFAHTHP
jgi:hypothetical protein